MLQQLEFKILWSHLGQQVRSLGMQQVFQDIKHCSRKSSRQALSSADTLPDQH